MKLLKLPHKRIDAHIDTLTYMLTPRRKIKEDTCSFALRETQTWMIYTAFQIAEVKDLFPLTVFNSLRE